MMNDSKGSENIYIPVVRFRFLSSTVLGTGTVHRRVDVVPLWDEHSVHTAAARERSCFGEPVLTERYDCTEHTV